MALGSLWGAVRTPTLQPNAVKAGTRTTQTITNPTKHSCGAALRTSVATTHPAPGCDSACASSSGGRLESCGSLAQCSTSAGTDASPGIGPSSSRAASRSDDGAPAWQEYYHAPGDGVYFNLRVIEDLIAPPFDDYYDTIPADCETLCFRTVPNANTVRAGWQRIANSVAAEEHTRDLLVQVGCSDMLVDLIQLGANAQHLGRCDEAELNSVVRATHSCASYLMNATHLEGDADVEAVVNLLRSPDKLRAVMTLKDHVLVLQIIVLCAKNLMLELHLPSRTPSPDEHAARSEALMESSLALVGAVAKSGSTMNMMQSPTATPVAA